MHHEPQSGPRLVGYVKLNVGGKAYSLPISAAPLASQDSSNAPGGFFCSPAGEVGILVDSGARPEQVKSQIARATKDAVRHLSRRELN